MKQLPLALQPDAAPPDFDGFIVGANAACVAELRALKPGSAPVYLWGPDGSGKTHLLRALEHDWQRDGRRASRFDAVRPLPWLADDGCSLLLLDDCDRFDDARQHAAFALFVAATQGGWAVASAGRVPPTDLALRDDLRTRLGWGPVYALQPLVDDEVRAVLRREAASRGIALGDEVVDYLLHHFARDSASLLSLLERLDGYSLASQRPVTIPLLKAMLAASAI